MRKLVLTRGMPGSGKSTLLERAGLGPHALSLDAMRLMIGAPTLTASGRLMIDQGHTERAFEMLRRLVNERMSRGETLAVDATFAGPGDLRFVRELAREHRYAIACADFSGFPLDVAVARDAARPEWKRAGEWAIRKIADQCARNPLDMPDVRVIPWAEDGFHEAALAAWLRYPVRDLSDCASVVHLGDLQGCMDVVTGEGGPLERGFRDDTHYVFVGDLLDRGIENGRVMRWFVDEALPRDNVSLLWGNHEDHLHFWARGREPVSNEFGLRTLPQLAAAGIGPEDAEAVVASALEFLAYTYRGERVLVTHAGLSTVPERMELIATRQCTHGTGYWEDPVDEQFERNAPEGWVQVHGHRNHGHVGVRATARSFNLEDSVEFGGCLRTATLSPAGWRGASYRNRVFRPFRERLALETKMTQSRVKARRAYPAWSTQGGETDMRIDDATLAAMRAHKGVREKVSESWPTVASLNFTRKVFYDRSWDDVVVKARGLFFDLDDQDIVSRGYEKFHNVGERPETTMEALKSTLRFPITLYFKENGFLGNTGYHRRTDRLFTASKSTPDGPFADMFRDILFSSVSEGAIEGVRRYLRDHECSMTFEVIDPVRDPHMIEYDAPKVVLLDVIRRTMAFEKASFEVVQEVGERFGLETKRRAMQFKNWAAFEGWYRRATSDVGYRLSGEHTEGVVIEDANGRMDKIKFGYYSFWKQMRGLKDRVSAALERGEGEAFSYEHTRRPGGEAPGEEEVELAHAFRDWCLERDAAELKSDVITLRRSFGRDFGTGPAPHAAFAL